MGDHFNPFLIDLTPNCKNFKTLSQKELAEIYMDAKRIQEQEAKDNETKRTIKSVQKNIEILNGVKFPNQNLKNVQNSELDKLQDQITELSFSLEQAVSKYQFVANKTLKKLQN